MRSSFMALITCIGSITIMMYFFKAYPSSEWWVEPLALVVAGLLTMLVLNVNALLSIGSAGLSMFLIDLKNDIFSNVIQREFSFWENMVIIFIIIVFIAIITEILLENAFTAFNIILDIILAVVPVAVILWILPLLDESFYTTNYGIMGQPIILLIYFLFIVIMNFKGSLREKIFAKKAKSE